MKIPDKAREPLLDKGTIYYFAGKKNYEENERSFKLPTWLSKFIEEEKKVAFEKGQAYLRMEIKKVLKID